MTQLEARNRELRALSERAINAQEEERGEIARSLHDDTGQALSMLIISLDRLEEKIPVEYKKKVRETRDLAANALAVRVDCLGTFPEDEFEWRAARKGSEKVLSGEALRFTPQGGISAYRYPRRLPDVRLARRDQGRHEHRHPGLAGPPDSAGGREERPAGLENPHGWYSCPGPLHEARHNAGETIRAAHAHALSMA